MMAVWCNVYIHTENIFCTVFFTSFLAKSDTKRLLSMDYNGNSNFSNKSLIYIVSFEFICAIEKLLGKEKRIVHLYL